MGAAQTTLQRLRRSLTGIDPGVAPALAERGREVRFHTGIDPTLGGGLACGAVHEFAPVDPVHLAAATGFAAALAALASRDGGEALWIATDFAMLEGGGPYGPGFDCYGLTAKRLLVLRVPHPVDALWAMEEALRCRALAAVIAELPGKGGSADLTATRRLTLAARDGAALGLLLRHSATPVPVAAATRWQIAAAPSDPDRFGGLGCTAFDLSLIKNRRGPSGRWRVTWDHHERTFNTAVSVGLAAAVFNRPDRAPLVRAG